MDTIGRNQMMVDGSLTRVVSGVQIHSSHRLLSQLRVIRWNRIVP